MAMTLTVIVYLTAYFLFFLAQHKITWKYDNLERKYRISKNKFIKLFIGIIGLIFTVIAFIISFIPPSGVKDSQVNSYTSLLIIVFIIILVLPFIIMSVSKKMAK